MLQQFIRQALRSGGCDDATSSSAADAGGRTLGALFDQLEPLVGIQGTRALLARGLHLTRSSLHWPELDERLPRDELLTLLGAHLERRAAADAWNAIEALLNALADLLVSLIGEPLSLRLLRSAWGEPAANAPLPEITP